MNILADFFGSVDVIESLKQINGKFVILETCHDFKTFEIDNESFL